MVHTWGFPSTHRMRWHYRQAAGSVEECLHCESRILISKWEYIEATAPMREGGKPVHMYVNSEAYQLIASMHNLLPISPWPLVRSAQCLQG